MGLLTVTATLEAICDNNDVPYLGYDIVTNAPGAQATITFSDEGESESVTVAVGSGVVLWPGAEIDDEGNGVDWPGWDQDADGVWFVNPENPFAWARGDVAVTIEVNPTFGPVSLEYPPAEPTCSANPPVVVQPPPPTTTPPPLPNTGASSTNQMALGVALLFLGAGFVLASRLRRPGR